MEKVVKIGNIMENMNGCYKVTGISVDTYRSSGTEVYLTELIPGGDDSDVDEWTEGSEHTWTVEEVAQSLHYEDPNHNYRYRRAEIGFLVFETVRHVR